MAKKKAKLPKKRNVALQTHLERRSTGAGPMKSKGERGSGKGSGKWGRHEKHKKARRNSTAETWELDYKGPYGITATYRLTVDENGWSLRRTGWDGGRGRFDPAPPYKLGPFPTQDAVLTAAMEAEQRDRSIMGRAFSGGFAERFGRPSSETIQVAKEAELEADLLEKLAYLMGQKRSFGFYDRKGLALPVKRAKANIGVYAMDRAFRAWDYLKGGGAFAGQGKEREHLRKHQSRGRYDWDDLMKDLRWASKSRSNGQQSRPILDPEWGSRPTGPDRPSRPVFSNGAGLKENSRTARRNSPTLGKPVAWNRPIFNNGQIWGIFQDWGFEDQLLGTASSEAAAKALVEEKFRAEKVKWKSNEDDGHSFGRIPRGDEGSPPWWIRIHPISAEFARKEQQRAVEFFGNHRGWPDYWKRPISLDKVPGAAKRNGKTLGRPVTWNRPVFGNGRHTGKTRGKGAFFRARFFPYTSRGEERASTDRPGARVIADLHSNWWLLSQRQQDQLHRDDPEDVVAYLAERYATGVLPNEGDSDIIRAKNYFAKRNSSDYAVLDLEGWGSTLDWVRAGEAAAFLEKHGYAKKISMQPTKTGIRVTLFGVDPDTDALHITRAFSSQGIAAANGRR